MILSLLGVDDIVVGCSQPAFLFHIQHPSSQVLVGVFFDYDSENFGINAHDPSGRVSNLQCRYRLSFDFRTSSFRIGQRTPPMGKLTFRLRSEYDRV
jgi:hypothetical protein